MNLEDLERKITDLKTEHGNINVKVCNNLDRNLEDVGELKIVKRNGETYVILIGLTYE